MTSATTHIHTGKGSAGLPDLTGVSSHMDASESDAGML
jgi:hypothetical protein